MIEVDQLTVAAGELGDLGLQHRLHQQPPTEPGCPLQDLRQRRIHGKQLIDVAADLASRRHLMCHGPGSFDDLAVLMKTYARPLI